MLNVGIHDNLVISKTAKNDKGTLVITVKQVSSKNMLETLSSGSSLESQEQQFFVYPPKLNAEDDSVSAAAKVAEVRDPLSLILTQYTTTDKSKFTKMFEGTGITAENYNSKLLDPGTMTKIYTNIVDQFIDLMKPFVGDNGKKMRMLFIRQSKEKAYPRLRNKFLEQQPFIEPMDVPVSRLAFSKYEKSKGLDISTPFSGTATTVSKQEAADAASHFS